MKNSILIITKLVKMLLVQVSFLLLGLSLIDASSFQVIIIGAGASGTAAATRLLENGMTNITILEAKNRIGGRIHTIKFGANVQDLGAQTVDGEIHNTVFEIAYPLNLIGHTEYDLKNLNYINAKGKILPHKILNDIMNHFEEFPELLNAPSNTTFGEYFTKIYNKYMENCTELDWDDKKNLLKLLHIKIKIDNGCGSWMELPTKANAMISYYDVQGAQDNHWKGRGFYTMLEILMKKLPDPTKELPYLEKVKLNKEVININWENDGVKVKCQDGSEYKADQVLVTTSLGVLKHQYHNLFTPSLPPAKIKAIKTIGFGVLDKIIFEFPYHWWWNNTQGFYFVWSKLNQAPAVQQLLIENPWLQEYSGLHLYDCQPNNMIGWITGDAARKIELIDEILVKKTILKLLRLVLSPQFFIPEPKNFIRTQWASDPHVRGSYSYNTIKMNKIGATNADLAAPIVNSKNVQVILFAGEATHSTRYATVHGAIETGWREANRILTNIN